MSDVVVPLAVGEPRVAGQLPEGWPVDIPVPSTAEIALVDLPAGGAYLEANDPADAMDVLDWYAERMADLGWLVLERSRLGPSARVRLARGTQRWLIVVASVVNADAPPGTAPHTWITLRRMLDEPPIDSVPDGGGALTCSSALPTTPPRASLRCRLVVGPPLADVPSDALHPDAAYDGVETAFAYVSEATLNLLTIRNDAVRSGPRALLELEIGEPALSFPQLLPGLDGWWLSWISGDPPERKASHFDRSLRRNERWLRLSLDLGRVADAGLTPVVYRERYPEYAVGWAEELDESLVFRIAGVKRDADRVRRSGRFPVGPGGLGLGPVLVSDGGSQLAIVWSGDAGIMVRPVGTDGLPDEPQHQVEPGSPTWLSAIFADDSFWVVWGQGERGFWARTNLDGCLDNARGSLQGEPLQAWSHPLGPLALVRRGERLELLRLADSGGDAPAMSTEVVGSTTLAVSWSDFAVAPDGLRGVIRLPTGYHPAGWECE